MDKICYLCAKKIESCQKESNDHVIPRLFIDREQPKAKGFDYGGYIYTHETCNNNFGPEDYCRKALKILSKINDPECITIFQHRQHASIKIMALNSECFEEFSDNELFFFNIRDVRKNSDSEIKDPKFIQESPPTNIEEKILQTTLAVITKSAAALLIKRYYNKIPPCWYVSAIPHHGDTCKLELNEIMGNAKPFDKDVKVYIKYIDGGVHLVLFLSYGLMLYMFFHQSENNENLRQISSKFPGAQHYYFKGSCINELLNYPWQKL